MHHQIKLIEKNRRKRKEIDLHKHALLCERIFKNSKKFIQFSLEPKIFCLQKRNS